MDSSTSDSHAAAQSADYFERRHCATLRKKRSLDRDVLVKTWTSLHVYTNQKGQLPLKVRGTPETCNIEGLGESHKTLVQSFLASYKLSYMNIMIIIYIF